VASLTSTQIAEILCEHCGIALPRQRVAAILEKEKGRIAVTRRGGRKYYKLMKVGEDELLGSGFQPMFIDPEKPLSSIRRFEEILANLEGEIRVCDSYVSSRTLDYIAQSSRASNVKILTENIQDSSRLKRDLTAFLKERVTQIEVRVSSPGLLHDRYILHSGGMLLVGASLKDLGKKQSMVVCISSSIASEIGRVFDREWNRAAKFT
jgi:hypothetical protein